MEFLLHNMIRLLQIRASTVLCLRQHSKCDHNMTQPNLYQHMVTGRHLTGYTGRQATSTAAMSPACGPQKPSEMVILTSATVRSIRDPHHCMATCMCHFDHNTLVWTLTKQTHARMSPRLMQAYLCIDPSDGDHYDHDYLSPKPSHCVSVPRSVSLPGSTYTLVVFMLTQPNPQHAP